MPIRRVVTGHDTTGKAVFVSDELVDATTIPMLSGSMYHELWSGDDLLDRRQADGWPPVRILLSCQQWRPGHERVELPQRLPPADRARFLSHRKFVLTMLRSIDEMSAQPAAAIA